jgi:hypothetical protein
MTLVKGKARDKLQDSKRGIAAHAKRAGGNAHGGAIEVKNIAVFVDPECDPTFDVCSPPLWDLPG